MPKQKEDNPLPKKQKNFTATISVVLETRDELKSEIRALDAKIDKMDAKWTGKFNELDGKWTSKFDELDHKWTAKFDELDHKWTLKFNELDAKWTVLFKEIKEIAEKALASAHRTEALMEQQRHENKIMFEALIGYRPRIDHIEERLDRTEKMLESLIKYKLEKTQ